MGGPTFSALGLLSSGLLRRTVPQGSTVREVAGWSTLGHGFILAGGLGKLC